MCFILVYVWDKYWLAPCVSWWTNAKGGDHPAQCSLKISSLQHFMTAAMWLLLKSERSLWRLLTIIFSSTMVGGAWWVGDSVNQSRWTENISIKVKNPLSQWKICLSKCVVIILFKNISNKHSKGPSLTFNNINIHTLRWSPGCPVFISSICTYSMIVWQESK